MKFFTIISAISTFAILLFVPLSATAQQWSCPESIDGGNLPSTIVCEYDTGCATSQSGLASIAKCGSASYPTVRTYGEIANLPAFIAPPEYTTRFGLSSNPPPNGDNIRYVHHVYTIHFLRDSVGKRAGHIALHANGKTAILKVTPSNTLANACLDVTGDNAVTAQDGIVIARYLLGVRGDALVEGQVVDSYQVENHMSALVE